MGSEGREREGLSGEGGGRGRGGGGGRGGKFILPTFSWLDAAP